MTSERATRRYDSPLRREQMEQTRVRILGVVAELLAEDAAELTIPLVAARARVSVRTVYRHFRSKEELLDAFAAWVDGQLGIVEPPAGPDAVPDFVSRVYRSFDEHDALIRAALLSRAGRAIQREVRARGHQPRYRAIERALAPLVAGLPHESRRGVLAVTFMLHSAPSWQALREYWGLEADEAAAAAAFAIRALLSEMRRTAGAADA